MDKYSTGVRIGGLVFWNRQLLRCCSMDSVEQRTAIGVESVEDEDDG